MTRSDPAGYAGYADEKRRPWQRLLAVEPPVGGSVGGLGGTLARARVREQWGCDLAKQGSYVGHSLSDEVSVPGVVGRAMNSNYAEMFEDRLWRMLVGREPRAERARLRSSIVAVRPRRFRSLVCIAISRLNPWARRGGRVLIAGSKCSELFFGSWANKAELF